MIKHIYNTTNKYMEKNVKTSRKKKGQFFTPVQIA